MSLRLLNPARSSEGDVTEFNKGGVVSVNVKGVKVFVPALRPRCAVTRTTLPGFCRTSSWSRRAQSARRKIVGSINKVTAEQNKAKREEFWANVSRRAHPVTPCWVVKSLGLLRCIHRISAAWTARATSKESRAGTVIKHPRGCLRWVATHPSKRMKGRHRIDTENHKALSLAMQEG